MEISVTFQETTPEVILEFEVDYVAYADGVYLDYIYPGMAGTWTLHNLAFHSPNMYERVSRAMLEQGWDLDSDGEWEAPPSVLETVA